MSPAGLSHNSFFPRPAADIPDVDSRGSSDIGKYMRAARERKREREETFKHQPYSNLYNAITTSSEDPIKYLVKHLEEHSTVNVFIMDRDTRKWSPVGYAIENKNLEIAKQLIEFGASLHEYHQCHNALYMAVYHEDIESVKYLLSQGAKPNIKGNCSLTPLQLASLNKQQEIIQVFKDHMKKIPSLTNITRTCIRDRLIKKQPLLGSQIPTESIELPLPNGLKRFVYDPIAYKTTETETKSTDTNTPSTSQAGHS